MKPLHRRDISRCGAERQCSEVRELDINGKPPKIISYLQHTDQGRRERVQCILHVVKDFSGRQASPICETLRNDSLAT